MVSAATPSQARFSESHEWFRQDGDVVTLGITQYAANELTDITYVEMKPTGTDVQPGSPVGEVESVKTTSDIYSAIGGSIVEVNKDVQRDPSLLNSDPYGKGWLVKIRTRDASPLSKLMDQTTYDLKHPV
jgi:glycine cleavage system H protein